MQTRRVQDLRSRLVMTDSLRVAAGVGLKASQWRRDGALAGLSADQVCRPFPSYTDYTLFMLCL